MFGHQNDESHTNDTNAISDASIHGVLNEQAMNSHEADSSTAAAGLVGDAQDDGANTSGNDQSWQHPGAPIDGQQAGSDVISPAGGFPKKPSFPQGSDDDSVAPVELDESATHELIDIKQHALTELSPLIDKLDQPPEEKFRTLMMMIQASDDQHLVKAAYAAAHAIEDETLRARALLDIVNEINYFTQQPEN